MIEEGRHPSTKELDEVQLAIDCRGRLFEFLLSAQKRREVQTEGLNGPVGVLDHVPLAIRAVTPSDEAGLCELGYMPPQISLRLVLRPIANGDIGGEYD